MNTQYVTVIATDKDNGDELIAVYHQTDEIVKHENLYRLMAVSATEAEFRPEIGAIKCLGIAPLSTFAGELQQIASRNPHIQYAIVFNHPDA